MKQKEPRISVRVDAQLKSRIEAVVAGTGIDEATLVRNCLEALCDYVEQTGSITFPLQVTPREKKPVASVVYPPVKPSINRLNEPKHRKP